MQTEVLIIGAGPTGLTLANLLARQNIDFIIIDEKEKITNLSKAMVVHARTLEIYQQIGLAENALQAGEPMNKVRICSGGEIRAEVNLSELGLNLSPFPYALILEQSKNEELLYNSLKSLNQEVLWQTKIEEFSQTEDGIEATIADFAGKTKIVEAKYLVGCDGAKSFVRHQLGLNFEGSTIEDLFYVADVEMDFPFERGALYPVLSEDSFILFFAMKGERKWRIIGNLPEYLNRNEKEIDYAEIEEKIKRSSELNIEITAVNWFSIYRVHSRKVNKFSEGNCFVAGDAAHIHTPAGGQGMNTGIQDAYNLAWKLGMVLHKKANPKLLESYNEERLPNAQRLLEMTDRMFQIGTSHNWLSSFLRTRVMPKIAPLALSFDFVKHFIFPFISQIGINYRTSSLSLSVENLATKAGDRMPYFQIDGKSIYDFLQFGKFHILLFAIGSHEYLKTKNEIEKNYGDICTCHIIPLYENVAEILGTNKDCLVLVRPDNYIGLITNDISGKRVSEYFEQIIL